MTNRGALALLALTTLLTACAPLPVGTDGMSLAERQNTLSAMSDWNARGRVAIDTGERAFQGSFTWRQRSDTLELVVRGPLGAGVLQVAGPLNALEVTARGETRRLRDAESELSALVGWWLPIGSLPAWLRGFADPAFPAATEAGPDGTLATLEQRSWTVNYDSYQLASLASAPGNVLVPRRIDLAYGELALRLTLDAWQPVAAATLP